MSKKFYEVIEKWNRTKSGKKSIFILDPLLTLVSIYCQISSMSADLDKSIEEMEEICKENDIAEGTHLLHSAKTMKAINYMREEKLKEALNLLENTYHL